MDNVNHQVDWATLVNSGRAKAYGVMWTEEEQKLLADGEATVAELREESELKNAKAVIAKNEAKGKEKKKEEKKEEKPEEKVEEKKEEKKVEKKGKK